MAISFASMVVYAETLSSVLRFVPEALRARVKREQPNLVIDTKQQYSYSLHYSLQSVKEGKWIVTIGLARGSRLSVSEIWALDSDHELTGSDDVSFKPEGASDSELQKNIDSNVRANLHWSTALGHLD